jgi:hypothetical protein
VIYSDNDPIAVTFAQEILGDTPNVRYIYCDVEEPHALLDSPAGAELLENDRRVGIGFVGIFLYVPDEPLGRFFNTLYEWVDQGSYIAVSAAGREVNEMEGMEEMFRKVGRRLYGRSDEEMLDVLGPWQLTEHGLVPGVYWGLPEDAPEINETIRGHGYTFVAYK